MTVAEPKAPAAAERVCRCEEPLLQTRASGKWTSERYCERCGLLAPIVFRR
jgi:hypothetical protein